VKTYSRIHNTMAVIGWITIIYLLGSFILGAINWFVNTVIPWFASIVESTGLGGV